jgi:hypothetical protein
MDMKAVGAPLVAALAVCSGAAFADGAGFKLVNQTGYQIDEVYVSPHASSQWGRDRMGSNSLNDGATVSIAFPHGGSACHYDIEVKYHDGDKAAWDDVDLCTNQKVTLHWDGEHTRATGD